MKTSSLLASLVATIVIAAGVIILLGPSRSFGATILTTNSSDSLTTFRTNVNTSLTNLNTDKLELSNIDALGKSYFFATSSADYWKANRDFFSTTSASYFSSLGLSFSTTSSDYWGSTKGYSTFAYPFIGNATTALLTFSNGVEASFASTSYYLAASGTPPTAGYLFAGGTNTGIASSIADTIFFYLGGIPYFAMDTGRLLVSASANIESSFNGGFWMESAAGTVSAPTYSFRNDTNTGLWSPEADTLAFTAGGVNSVLFGNASSTFVGNATTTGNHAFGSVRVPSEAASAGAFVAFDPNGLLIATSTPASGSGFSTTSALYFSSLGLAFSTTSSNHWASRGLGFSTTSANTWSSFGLGFSTTSATAFANASTTIVKTYSNNTYTGGANDFGGATSLEVPNGSAPTVDAIGEVAIDTTGPQFLWATSTNASFPAVVMPFVTITAGHATSTWAGTTTQYLAPAAAAGRVTEAYCETSVGTVGVSLYDGTNRATYMPTASTTINLFRFATNNTFTAGESIRVDFGTPASSPTQVACRFKFVYDRL